MAEIGGKRAFRITARKVDCCHSVAAYSAEMSDQEMFTGLGFVDKG
jgi:hypothetical protein